MVKVEMEYNPYLKKQEIKFNQRKPRINSPVEKYESDILQVWISKMPQIFYDEMNGYDFKLEFTGTKLEFEDIEKVFDGKTVKLVHKKELESRDLKISEINNLLKWLLDTENDYVDILDLRRNNEELFKHIERGEIAKHHNYIIIYTENIAEENTKDFEKLEVYIKTVNRLKELETEELKNTPVLIYVRQNTEEKVKNTIKYLLNKKKVKPEQLFFMLLEIDVSEKERVIRGLEENGVENPQIVESVYDSSIKRYLEVYSVSGYIFETIKKLECFSEDVKKAISEANAKLEATCSMKNKEKENHEKDITVLNEKKERLSKWKKEEFEENEKQEWNLPKVPLCGIARMKNKIISEQDAERELELIGTITSAYENWAKKDVYESIKDKEKSINNTVNEICGFIIDDGKYEFIPGRNLTEGEVEKIFSLKNELKDSRYMKSANDQVNVPVLGKRRVKEVQVKERNYYDGNEWYSRIENVLKEIEGDIKKDCESNIKKYGQKILGKYEEKLNAEINSAKDKKNDIDKEIKKNRGKEKENQSYYQNLSKQLNAIQEG